MPSNEGHIHWSGSEDETVNYLDQELRLTSNVSNASTASEDPIGTVRIKLDGSQGSGLALPSDGWEEIPGTLPTLEARMDGGYPMGYIRVRQG